MFFLTALPIPLTVWYQTNQKRLRCKFVCCSVFVLFQLCDIPFLYCFSFEISSFGIPFREMVVSDDIKDFAVPSMPEWTRNLSCTFRHPKHSSTHCKFPHPYSMHWEKFCSQFTKFRSGIPYISNVSHSLAPLCIEWKFLEGRGQGGAAHTPRPLFVCALSQLWTLKCRDEIHIVEERRTLLCVKGNFFSLRKQLQT